MSEEKTELAWLEATDCTWPVSVSKTACGGGDDDKFTKRVLFGCMKSEIALYTGSSKVTCFIFVLSIFYQYNIS